MMTVGRIEHRKGVGITAKQSRDGLRLGAHVGTHITEDVYECAEQLGMHHGQVQRTRPSRGKADNTQLARSVLTPKFDIINGTTSFVR